MNYGAKKTLGISMLIGSIFTILIVPSAQLGYGFLMGCRFLIGLAHVCFNILKNFCWVIQIFLGYDVAGNKCYVYKMGASV